jgi:hypothetical protein
MSTSLMTDHGEFGGVHCETSSVRKVLLTQGIDISEAVLFGLGGGIGFWYQPVGPSGRFRSMTSTRNGPFPIFVERMCTALGLTLTVHRTSDPDRGLDDLRGELASGRPVVCYADMFHLPYFQASRHFGGHAVVVYGLDEESGRAWLSDRCPGPIEITTEQLATARSSPDHPFPPQHAWLQADWKAARLPDAEVVRAAFRACGAALAQTELPNEGLAGMASFSSELAREVRSSPAPQVIDRMVAAYIDFEYAGTGGSGFRKLYRDFLVAAQDWLPGPALTAALAQADQVLAAWTAVTELLIPGWGPDSAALREGYEARQSALYQGTDESLREAADHTARLPELLAAAAAELGDYRDPLAADLSDALRALLAAELILLRALTTI